MPAATLAMAVAAVAGCGGPSGEDPDTSAGARDGVVARARADVEAHRSSVTGYRGPADGPRAQQRRLVAFVAADLTNGGIAGVARGVEEAARAIGWPLEILDGRASPAGRRRAMRAALALRPGGIILGGFDSAEQRAAIRAARARGIPVVGWHAGDRPGPDPRTGLFTNVTTSPAAVARLAAHYAIADSDGTAGAVIFTDSEFAIARSKADVMAAELRTCRRCRVLQVVDSPISDAPQRMPAVVSELLQRFGARLRYLLTINGAYVAGARPALVDAGRRGDDPPYQVAAGDGDAAEFARIRGQDYQRASVAEPLYLHGWQLIDELNRARAGKPASGYVAPPRLVTTGNVPTGGVFDPPSGYRRAYRRIWGR
jgi:ribose transport system substrate-binding protein